MGKKKKSLYTEEFKREAVRILLSSELTLAEVANDLGIGDKILREIKHRSWLSDVRQGIATAEREQADGEGLSVDEAFSHLKLGA